MNTDKLHPGLSVDCVIFGFHENELKVLLLKLKRLNQWALPGGFVARDQDVDDEAVNVLKRRTGLENIFLHQFHLFGRVSRNEPGHADNMVAHQLIEPELRDWFDQRFVTAGYYALVEYRRVMEPTPDLTSEICEWKSLHDLPVMILDHQSIIRKAHEILKKELNHQPIGLNLLPDRFTMPELQALYETVLEKSLDRRNFRRKMLSYDILVQTNERRTGGAHKAPMLYHFDLEKYHFAIEKGLKSGW
ncbi:MAG: NUDIX hydrolase [Marinoscillum sp.]